MTQSSWKLRFRRKPPGTPPPATKLLLTTVLVGATIYSVRSTPTAIVGSGEVAGNSVLVLQDTSGSMGGTGVALAAQIERLRAAGIALANREQIQGFGVMRSGSSSNLLNALERTLPLNPDVDTIYVFSDYQWVSDPPVDASDPAGYQRLRQLLSDRRVRMYLATVNQPPEGELIRVATDSGGGVIEAR